MGPLGELAFNAIIERVAPGILEDYNPVINDLVAGFAKPMVSEALGDMDMMEILKLLTSPDPIKFC